MLGPPSPCLARMLRASIIPKAAHGSDGAAPASPRNFLGGLSRSPTAGSTTHRSSTSLRGDKKQEQGVSNNEMTAEPKRAERLRHKPQHCATVTWPKATTSKAVSPVSQPFALYKYLAQQRSAPGASSRSWVLAPNTSPLVRHHPPFLSRVFFIPLPWGKQRQIQISSEETRRNSSCQPRSRGLCSVTCAGGSDACVLPEQILPCPAPG